MGTAVSARPDGGASVPGWCGAVSPGHAGRASICGWTHDSRRTGTPLRRRRETQGGARSQGTAQAGAVRESDGRRHNAPAAMAPASDTQPRPRRGGATQRVPERRLSRLSCTRGGRTAGSLRHGAFRGHRPDAACVPAAPPGCGDGAAGVGRRARGPALPRTPGLQPACGRKGAWPTHTATRASRCLPPALRPGRPCLRCPGSRPVVGLASSATEHCAPRSPANRSTPWSASAARQPTR